MPMLSQYALNISNKSVVVSNFDHVDFEHVLRFCTGLENSSAEKYSGFFGSKETGVARNGTVPFTGNKEDRCQGSGVGSVSVSDGAEPNGSAGSVCVSGFCVSRYFDRRARNSGAFRTANRSGRYIFFRGEQDVVADTWRRGLYEARWRRAAGDYRFHSGFRRYYRSRDLCGARRSFSALGAVCIDEDARRNPTRANARGRSFNLRRGSGMVVNFGGKQDSANGGSVHHVPVLLSEVISALEPSQDKLIFDGTFGAGGYSGAILGEGANVIATDQDPDVIQNSADICAEFDGRLTLHQAKFSEILDYVEESSLDGFVLDIGVSSMQIDQAGRGFSFMQDGPLDMRMSQNGVTAADVVNRLKPGDLARIFGFYGEEKKAGKIARAIVSAREEEMFETTAQLAKLIEKIVPRKMKDRIHPATRVFQALRIYVNDELGELARALLAAEKSLKPGGRLAVVTFHSLEDRIVKKFFADRFGRVSGSRHLPQVDVPDASFEPIGKKAMISASKHEAEANPRARSAKLRAGIRTSSPVGSQDMALFGLPKLYSLQSLARQL